MRKNVCEKFTNNAVVRPLYRKVRNRKVRSRKGFVSLNISSSVKLCGNEINVKRKVYDGNGIKNSIEFNVPNNNLKEEIPGTCESVKDSKKYDSSFDYKVLEVSSDEHVNLFRGKTIGDCVMTDARYSKNKNPSEIQDVSNDKNDPDNVKDSIVTLHKVPDRWLRVFPCPKAQGESISSVIFRCFACQLGLAAILVIWNLIWVFIIQHFEGPYEIQVSSDFHREQNQLVIDLATELRQPKNVHCWTKASPIYNISRTQPNKKKKITPLSPKWRAAIELRIDEERRLTMAAVGRGVHPLPGHFWDLPGTFLFTIYVLTALGFGAPVPQTTHGRTAALIYAALAIPAHIYLMMNASTCVIVNMDHCLTRMKQCFRLKAPFSTGNTFDSARENFNDSSGNQELKVGNCRRKIWCIISVLSVRSFVPLVCALYYTLGAIGFGWMRGKAPLEIVMFPLEFTTTGGLENVPCHIRIIYGFYVEGAMCLLALTLQSIRRHSSAAATAMARRYRLFTSENGVDC